MRGSMDKTTVELDGELLEALAIAAPAPLPGSVWHRLFEHGLSRGGRPRKTGRAALPVSGPVTLAGFRKGFLARCRKLADIPDAEFEELLGIYRREGKIPTLRHSAHLASATARWIWRHAAGETFLSEGFQTRDRPVLDQRFQMYSA